MNKTHRIFGSLNIAPLTIFYLSMRCACWHLQVNPPKQQERALSGPSTPLTAGGGPPILAAFLLCRLQAPVHDWLWSSLEGGATDSCLLCLVSSCIGSVTAQRPSSPWFVNLHVNLHIYARTLCGVSLSRGSNCCGGIFLFFASGLFLWFMTKNSSWASNGVF